MVVGELESAKLGQIILKLTLTTIENGEIAPSEGEAVARILDIHSKAIELHDFEKTLNELKEQADTK